MKTIDERAIEYADKESKNIFSNSTDEVYKKVLYEDYVKIATEQKAIDNEKYKRLRELAYNMYNKMMNLNTDLRPLRKSMEEFHHYICFEEEKYENN